MKKQLSVLALGFVLAFGMTTTASFAAQGGSIGQGDFSVMKDEQLVDKLSGQNPLKDEDMLVCDGKCMVKSEGISLVASDQAKFAVKNEADTFRLLLREGLVDYVITDKARKVAFHTPDGVYSVAEIVFNAASNPVVRGSVRVTKEGKTEIEVKEGQMIFATADGMKAVGANEKIVLAIAEVPAAGGGFSFSNAAGLMAWGAVSTAAAVGSVVHENSTDSTPVLPPTPSPSN